jgi:uncharacterized membrane-anchored protein YhcB (DUF1043 family)
VENIIYILAGIFIGIIYKIFSTKKINKERKEMKEEKESIENEYKQLKKVRTELDVEYKNYKDAYNAYINAKHTSSDASEDETT